MKDLYKKKAKLILTLAFLVGVTGVIVMFNDARSKNIELSINILKKEDAVIITQKHLLDLNKQKIDTEDKLKEKTNSEEQLKKQVDDLNTQLQARIEQKRQLAALSQVGSIKSTVRATANGDCMAWLQAAGVNDINSALILIQRESGCRTDAVNPSSGACGVGQALPCSKTGCSMSDGYCQTAWMNSYVIGRYSSWSNALAHSYAVGWY